MAYRYKENEYTALKMTIPEKLATNMSIKKGDDAEFAYTGSTCFINFNRKARLDK